MKFKNNIKSESIKNNNYLCSYIDTNINNIGSDIFFIKLNCYLDNTILKCNNISIVYYDHINKIMVNTYDDKIIQKVLDNYFNFFISIYNKNTIIYGAIRNVKVIYYNLTYNICKKIKKFNIFNNTFSFNDFSLYNKIISNFEFKKFKNKNDIINDLNTKINDLNKENIKYNDILTFYQTENKYYQDIIIVKEYINVNNNNIDNYNKIKNEIINSFFTLKELNDFLKNGIVIDELKYIDYISNDNSIYFAYK